MPLRPFDVTHESNLVPDEIANLLQDSGLAPREVKENSKINNARKVFDAAGASLDNIADNVARIMARGDTDAGRLKASELALKVHGILQELDDKPVPQITININGSENKTLINLVLPVTL